MRRRRCEQPRQAAGAGGTWTDAAKPADKGMMASGVTLDIAGGDEGDAGAAAAFDFETAFVECEVGVRIGKPSGGGKEPGAQPSMHFECRLNTGPVGHLEMFGDSSAPPSQPLVFCSGFALFCHAWVYFSPCSLE